VQGSGEEQIMLGQLEMFAEKMFGPATPEERAKAQEALQGFSSQVEYLSQCQFILQRSTKPYAQFLASSSIFKLSTSYWNKFTPEQTVELKSFLLSYLIQNALTVSPFVLMSLIQSLCRVVKLGWLVDLKHRDFVMEVASSFRNSTPHLIVGSKILSELVDQINLQLKSHSIMQHRKVAVSFRDSSLFEIFQTGISVLQGIESGQYSADPASEKDQLKSEILKLIYKCLTFDYIGTNSDESSDEFGSLQIPGSWRVIIEDTNTLPLFFNALRDSSEQDSSQVGLWSI